MEQIKKASIIPFLALAALGGAAVTGYAAYASAQEAGGTAAIAQNVAGMFNRGPHVGGTITAINGSTLTVTGRDNTSYTIETSGATFTENGAASSLAELAVGEKVMAHGTLNGTTLTATDVHSGMPKSGMRGPHGKGHGLVGTVSAVNGSTITMTGKDGQTYTVNTDAASVKKMVAGSLSDIAVGDQIGIQGSVSGTTVTANTIMDDLPEPPVPPQQ